MRTVQSRSRRLSRRALETSGLVVLIVLLALPFTRAFADDFRYGPRAGNYAASSVQGWRLGGGYRTGGYEIWHFYRGDWRRMPGRAVQIGGNPRNPWVVNSQGERYQWTGRDWRLTGYANRRGFNGRGAPVPAFRNDRAWNNNRNGRNNRYDGGRSAPRAVVERQRNRIEVQQDRIQDLRRDLQRERIEDRRDDRRDQARNRNGDRRENRVENRREDRGERNQGRRNDGQGNNGRGDRGGSRNGPR